MGTMGRYFSALAVVGLVAAATPACATSTYRYGPPPNAGYARGVERRAYDRGFHEGVEEGRNDARHNRRFSYDRHNEYRDADDGYHRGEGDREFYRRSYRAGFEAGYNEGFNRYARR